MVKPLKEDPEIINTSNNDCGGQSNQAVVKNAYSLRDTKPLSNQCDLEIKSYTIEYCICNHICNL